MTTLQSAHTPTTTTTEPAGSFLALNWSEILTWDHDQVLRYTLAARLIDRLLSGRTGKVTLLDVGCNVLQLWKHLLDPARVNVVRADVEVVGDGADFVLLERDRPLPFADGSFDVVVAMEVLEHLPCPARETFLEDCFRVSREGALWSCPEGRHDVQAAEMLASAAFADRHGQEHPFLGEHAEFIPPTRAELTHGLQRLEVPFALFANAPISRWLAVMLLSETLHEQAIPLAVRERLNQQLGTSYPVGEAPYRIMAVAARTFAATVALEPLPEGSSGVLLSATPAGEPDPAPRALNLLARLTGLVGRALLEESHSRRLAEDQVRAAEAALERADPADYQRQILTLGNFAQGVSSSWTWRMLAPLRGVRRWLGSRRYGAENLVPLRQLRPITGTVGAYEATGDDPQFLLPCTLPAGWIRLDYRLHSTAAALLEVYLDHGDGFAAETCVDRVPVEGTTARTRYLYLPRPVRALRFDPVNKTGTFRLERFEVRTLPPWEAFGRAVSGKLGLLFKYRCFGPALLRGLGLLARGRVGEFARKMYDGLHGNTSETPAAYSHERAYERWYENRRLTEGDRVRLRAEAATMANPPLISLLMPTHNTPEPYLRQAIESVLRQTYPHWQLCIADDASTAPHVRPILQEYASREPRISLVWRTTSGHISAATNSALEVARGDYIALLDHDDEIAEHALSRVASALVADRTLDMVYSDEDKIEPDGRHTDPFFKPDWSPEYFLGCMYTCHLGVYRTSLARAIGGFRSEFDTAQDYDFVLRLTARTTKIAHIPDVLYHWRKTPTSTASGPAAKPKAHEIAANALRSWLADNGHEGRVESTGMPGFHRVRFALKTTPTISIVIPSGCKRAVLHGRETWFVSRCVESLREQTTYPNIEVIVLYNDTLDADLERHLNRHDVRLVNYRQEGGTFNLARKMNVGATHASGEQLVFLNDDIEVLSRDWLEAMLEYSQQPGVGAVGAKLLFPNGRLQHGGVLIPGGNPTHAFYAYPAFYPGYFNSQAIARNWVAVTGACMMTRADVFRDLGGFDTIFPLNYNDVDYCLRLREAGLRCVSTPYARLVHHESVTKEGFFPVELETFHRRWRSRLPHDPYYNPNFDQSCHDFRIHPGM